jgi:hypothetical protein
MKLIEEIIPFVRETLCYHDDVLDIHTCIPLLNAARLYIPVKLKNAI